MNAVLMVVSFPNFWSKNNFEMIY